VPRPDDPQSFNRYSYVLNNPLRYTDPSGHQADEVCGVLQCLNDDAKAQLQRRLESTRLGRAMFDKLRAKDIDLMKQVTIAVLPGPRRGISLPLASGNVAMPGPEAHWRTPRGGHLIMVGAEGFGTNDWVALVGHELFHAFQREVGHELPHNAHRDREFTTQQFEREAFIFEYIIAQELGVTEERLEQLESAFQALSADVTAARNWLNEESQNPLYRSAPDDLRSGHWREALAALFKPPRIK
jgi:hypothetical protein